jgi:precorrin-6A/cobalt-precorrin-6A reductase
VPDFDAAVRALGITPRRVLLTIGQKDLTAFASAPWHYYVIRSVDSPRPEHLPSQAEVITARGPFVVEEEHALLRQYRIGVVVTKNSGGAATAAKLSAARRLDLPVIMVSRPAAPAAEAVTTVEEALAWLGGRHAAYQRGE